MKLILTATVFSCLIGFLFALIVRSRIRIEQSQRPLNMRLQCSSSVAELAGFSQYMRDRWASSEDAQAGFEIQEEDFASAVSSVIDQALSKNIALQPVPQVDEIVMLQESKAWVNAIISNFAVCPYTKNAEKAGVPVGNIEYIISHALTVKEAYADYWQAVFRLTQASDRQMSTILLIYPQFQNSWSAFQAFTEELDVFFLSFPELSPYIDNVYFHPDFKFVDKDGQTVFIFDEYGDIIGTSDEIVEGISFARRSPYPLVNILRSAQVSRVQRVLPEGKIFQSNRERLGRVGVDKLQMMLEKRDWSLLPHIPHDFFIQSQILKDENITDENRGNDDMEEIGENIDEDPADLAEKWLKSLQENKE